LLEEVLWKHISLELYGSLVLTSIQNFFTSQQRVTCLEDSNGLLICGRDNIGSFLMEHFNSRFTSSHPILDDNLFDLVEKVITEEENVGLCLIPDEKEYFFLQGSLLDGMIDLFCWDLN
jgi:hypothetical protein